MKFSLDEKRQTWRKGRMGEATLWGGRVEGGRLQNCLSASSGPFKTTPNCLSICDQWHLKSRGEDEVSAAPGNSRPCDGTRSIRASLGTQGPKWQPHTERPSVLPQRLFLSHAA